MERVGGEDRGQTSAIRKVAGASLIGTTIEWYDFFIYGTAAALVFPALFFPEFSETAGTLAAFATFGVGFFARPVGGVIFGHFGDRIGRKTMLVLTLTIMGVATTLIGLMPTFEQIGIWAPLLLVVLRFAQGLGVGGEWGGAVLMAVEHSPAEKRGFFGSWPQMGVPAGLILSNLIFLAVSTLPEAQFLAWGWRIPFVLSVVLVGMGISAFLLFWATDTGSFWLVLAAHIFGLGALSVAYGPQAAFYAEMFGTRVRYSGISLGYQGGSIFGGALAPFIATWLFASTGTSTSIAVYVAALAVLSFVCAYMAAETRDVDIDAEQDEERQLIEERGGATTS